VCENNIQLTEDKLLADKMMTGIIISINHGVSDLTVFEGISFCQYL
jgi:hypothetical protein